MKTIEITDIKKFTNELFAGSTFDRFLVTEASFSTLFTTTIDGHINGDFLAEGQDGSDGRPAEWKSVKPVCYAVLRGNRVPLKFRVVLMAPEEQNSIFIKNSGISFPPENINGLYINIRFENNRLFCVTGTSLKTFSLDRSVEEAWDKRVTSFLTRFSD